MWHDLSEDDLILPAQGNEYVLKGSELLNASPSGNSSARASDHRLMFMNTTIRTLVSRSSLMLSRSPPSKLQLRLAEDLQESAARISDAVEPRWLADLP